VRILVTGHRGFVGTQVASFLQGRGHEVAGFDLADGADLLDLAAVGRAAAGCAAVVHLGALAHDSAGSPDQIMAVNVLGTWHVLLAAETAGVQRVVQFSSAQVFGIAEGERLPDYFPVDDAHPRRAMRPYGLSKRLAEDLCDGFTARTGIATVCLRPVEVWAPAQYQRTRDQWRADPRSEWHPYWEYGAFVDVRDVAAAVGRAHGAARRPPPDTAVRCRHRRHRAQPRPRLATHPPRAGHRPGPLPRRSLASPRRLLSRHGGVWMAARPPLVHPRPAAQAITPLAANEDAGEAACVSPCQAWIR